MIGHSKVRWVTIAFLGMMTLLSLTQEAQISLPKGAVARLGTGKITGNVVFSPDGRYLAVGTSLGIELRDVKTLELVWFFQGHTSSVRSVVFSPDGKILASGSRDEMIKLWDVLIGRELYTLKDYISWINSVVFSPHGQLLALGSRDDTIKIWEVSMWWGRKVRTLKGHTSWVESVAFSPNGKLLASGSADHTVKLWDVSTGEKLYTLKGHTDTVWSVAFSPDGGLLASGSEDQTIRLWNVLTGGEVHVLKGHTNDVNSVAFSPDGRILVSGSDDSTIKLWEVSSGRELRTLKGHTSQVWSVAFSPDGKLLASGSSDGTVLIWDMTDILNELTNEPPRASFSYSPSSPTVGQPVLFDASSSYDPDGTITSYSWDFGDSSTGLGQTVSHTYTRSGTFIITLTVTDDDGATASTFEEITVVEANEPPEARFTYSPERPLVGQEVTFDASSSSDPDGHIVLYEWDFGDGVKDYGMIVTHAFTTGGTYEVRLEVTDDDGATASITKEIEVLQSGGDGGPA